MNLQEFEFWFWVGVGVASVIFAKVTGRSISQRIQGTFGQTLDYGLMLAVVIVQVLLYVHKVIPLPDITSWQTVAAPIIRNVVVGHWFWHEDKGGKYDRVWLYEKLGALWKKCFS